MKHVITTTFIFQSSLLYPLQTLYGIGTLSRVCLHDWATISMFSYNIKPFFWHCMYLAEHFIAWQEAVSVALTLQYSYLSTGPLSISDYNSVKWLVDEVE
jgi:hypothetical protein